MTAFNYWWRAIRWPVALSMVAAWGLVTTNADLAIARGIFFDSAQMRWRGGDSWWVNEFIHSGGGWLIRCIIVAAGGLWTATLVRERLLRWRRPAAYFLISTLLTVGVVGLLKQLTNIDCPWDLLPFGGRFPYMHLFADRPDALRAAHCFPAAHASSGYALMALYFIALEHGRSWARTGLVLGAAAGLVFGFAQQSRGAHFLSHDLCSATLAWCISLTVYCGAFRCQLWLPVTSACAIRGDDHCAGAPILINMPG